MEWTKASASAGGDGACVELAAVQDGVAVRDSKDPGGPVLHFTQDEMRAFADGVAKSEFDHLWS